MWLDEAKIKTAEEKYAESYATAWESYKETRGAAVERITVIVSSGKVFDGDENSQNRMARAVALGELTETTQWKLADNTVATVTVSELKEALRLAGEAQTDIWMGAPV